MIVSSYSRTETKKLQKVLTNNVLLYKCISHSIGKDNFKKLYDIKDLDVIVFIFTNFDI